MACIREVSRFQAGSYCFVAAALVYIAATCVFVGAPVVAAISALLFAVLFVTGALASAAACVRYDETRLVVHALFHEDEEIAYQDIESVYHEWVRTGGTRSKTKWRWRATYRSGGEVKKATLPLPQDPDTPVLKPLWDAIRVANPAARLNVSSAPR